MQNIESLTELFKRDTKGKVRTWTVQYGWDNNDVAGIRTISGLVDGEKITSVWNMSAPTNVGRSNARNTFEQAKFEAQAEFEEEEVEI